MSNTKFSGPWHVIADSQGYANIHHKSDDDGDTGDIVATCFQDDDHAHLIAAAPELYDALQLVLDTYGFDSSTDSSIWQTVTAALAKARGE